jgi:hypothetical protein
VLTPPSPKVQDQDVGLPVDVSEKVTVWPVVGAAGEKVKAAVGAGTLTVTALLAVPEPPAFVAVRVTV